MYLLGEAELKKSDKSKRIKSIIKKEEHLFAESVPLRKFYEPIYVISSLLCKYLSGHHW